MVALVAACGNCMYSSSAWATPSASARATTSSLIALAVFVPGALRCYAGVSVPPLANEYVIPPSDGQALLS
jgi:hypothetical protein